MADTEKSDEKLLHEMLALEVQYKYLRAYYGFLQVQINGAMEQVNVLVKEAQEQADRMAKIVNSRKVKERGSNGGE